MKGKTFKAGTLNKQQAGFTLFELIVVLAIVGVIVGVTVPNISLSSPERDMATAIRRIAGAVSEARSRALLKQSSLELRLSSNQLTLYKRKQNKTTQLGKSRLPDGVQIVEVLIDAKNQRTLKVNSKGIMQAATVYLSSGSYRKTVTIRPVQGISY